jgi:segregation and condensation protein A
MNDLPHVDTPENRYDLSDNGSGSPALSQDALKASMIARVDDDAPHYLFSVNLDLFDGPMDLLLHLVKQHELPIERVSLALVTEQFMAILDEAVELDFELAGEYLVVAATLLAIKSSILLNKPVEVQIDQAEEGPDPEEELLQRLRELERFRESAQQLGARPLLGVDVFAPVPEPFAPGPPVLRDHDALLLGRALRRLIDRAPAELRSLVITTDSVPIAARMVQVIERLTASHHGVPFSELVGEAATVPTIIATFLALLELCKRQAIQVEQPAVFGDILISLAPPTHSGEPLSATTMLTSEFDQQNESVEDVEDRTHIDDGEIDEGSIDDERREYLKEEGARGTA